MKIGEFYYSSKDLYKYEVIRVDSDGIYLAYLMGRSSRISFIPKSLLWANNEWHKTEKQAVRVKIRVLGADIKCLKEVYLNGLKTN